MILVVFVFLRSAWATVIPSVAVPLSLVGTFGVMYLVGYTIDNLSLMALTISTGFVVDDAIVVIENITRYLEQGMTPLEAALKGSREIGFTVVSMSISLIAVFIPILLMGGIVGRMFREFAVTLSVAVGISLIVSLTTTPTMCAKFLKSHEHDAKHNWLYRASDAGFQWMQDGYARSLRWVLRHQPLGVWHHAGNRRPGRLSVRRGSQGLLPAAGYRANQWQRPGPGRHGVCDHARQAECNTSRLSARIRRSTS